MLLEDLHKEYSHYNKKYFPSDNMLVKVGVYNKIKRTYSLTPKRRSDNECDIDYIYSILKVLNA